MKAQKVEWRDEQEMSASDWRPMSTAPKDGRYILAYGMAYSNLVKHGGLSWFTQDINEPKVAFTTVIQWHETWYEVDVDAGGGLFRKENKLAHEGWRPHAAHVFQPTHWMPLPKPPA